MSDNIPAKSSVRFWRPLGAMGCLWRSVVFLLGILLLCFILAMLLRGCDPSGMIPGGDNPVGGGGKDGEDREFVYDPEEDEWSQPVPDTIPSYDDRDKAPVVRDWNDSIPGVPELPRPDDNYIPPVDSTNIVTDPTDPYGQIVGDQLNVFFNSTDLKGDIARFARRFKQLYPGPSYNVAYYNVEAGTMILTVPTAELEQVAGNLERQITDIDFIVVTNEIMDERSKPGDPAFGSKHNDTYFNLIQAYDAWDITKGSPDVKVAIVDSYFDLSNPEIGERYVDAIHIPSKTRAVMPPRRAASSDDEYTAFSHGSHVAGISIGSQNNSRGASGIAPGCTWIPVSLGDELSQFNIIEGVLYAIYHGADVVNLSIGRAFPEGIADMVSLEEQVDYVKTQAGRNAALWQYVGKVAADHNCVIVTSAGNETLLMGMDPKNRPTNIIKVEAVDETGIKADFSNYGKVPEDSIDFSTVAAPGVNLWSVLPQVSLPFAKACGIKTTADGFGEMSGTSMASPVVAGGVALLKSKNKDLSADDIIKILTMTARQTDTKHRIGPTIQLADALNATGGELLNFDDLMKDHDMLVGKWKSTHELYISNENEGKVDDMWTYFIFTSPDEGRLEHHCIRTHRVYSAPLRVVWGSDHIKINQTDQARTPQGDTLIHDDFLCRPNKDRLLEAHCMRGGKEQFNFMLEKVN